MARTRLRSPGAAFPPDGRFAFLFLNAPEKHDQPRAGYLCINTAAVLGNLPSPAAPLAPLAVYPLSPLARRTPSGPPKRVSRRPNSWDGIAIYLVSKRRKTSCSLLLGFEAI
jgi:hypothetical protein